MNDAQIGQVASAITPNTRQQYFLRYFTAILTDLVVLNLFNEYWDRVHIASFTISLFAAVLLQLLLQLTLHIEHRVDGYFKARAGLAASVARWVGRWFVLFVSKFIILYIFEIVFSGEVHFGGPAHGVVAFIAVILSMLAAEELLIRFYRRLGQ
jgi:hypothetical protein